jgi:hypothetical protein
LTALDTTVAGPTRQCRRLPCLAPATGSGPLPTAPLPSTPRRQDHLKGVSLRCHPFPLAPHFPPSKAHATCHSAPGSACSSRSPESRLLTGFGVERRRHLRLFVERRSPTISHHFLVHLTSSSLLRCCKTAPPPPPTTGTPVAVGTPPLEVTVVASSWTPLLVSFCSRGHV